MNPLKLLSILSLLPTPVVLGASRPNVLFIFADDIRAESVFEIEGDEIDTPNLDRLARHGMTFRNAYTMGSLTAPVCMASRAMVLTGRGVFRQEHRGRNIPESMTAFPEALSKAGYSTFVSGKWHNDRESLHRMFESGGSIMGNPKPHQFEFQVTDFSTGRKSKHQGEHTTDLIVGEAVQFLEARDDRPFFMYLSFSAAHWPWEAPWRWMSRYDANKISLPDNFRGEHPFDNGELGKNGTTTETKYIGLPRDPAEVREIIAAYYAMISHLDDGIGRLLEALQRRSLLENTLVIFSSDNGLALGQHGLLSKQNIYESGVRVPLVFSGPDVPKGASTEALVYLSDIFPTVCELMGVPIPESVTGKSQASVISGRSPHVRDSLVVVYKNYMRGFRMGPWKLHQYHVRGQRKALLYHLENDPWENVDLIGDEEYRPVLEKLEIEMQRQMRLLGDEVDLSAPDWGTVEIPEHPFGREYWRRLENGS